MTLMVTISSSTQLIIFITRKNNCVVYVVQYSVEKVGGCCRCCYLHISIIKDSPPPFRNRGPGPSGPMYCGFCGIKFNFCKF